MILSSLSLLTASITRLLVNTFGPDDEKFNDGSMEGNSTICKEFNFEKLDKFMWYDFLFVGCALFSFLFSIIWTFNRFSYMVRKKSLTIYVKYRQIIDRNETVSLDAL